MDYYLNIKDHLIRNEINHRIKDYSKNKSDLETYYEVGKLLVIAQGGEKRAKYGDRLIKEYSERLTRELGAGYSTRSLKRMRLFYLKIEKGTTLLAQLSWSHYVILLPIKNIDEVNYYIDLTIKFNLSVRELQLHIKNKDYERLDESTKLKLVENKDPKLIEIIKNPIIISNPNNLEVYKEITLQKLILEDIPAFLKELGSGFTFIENEYKIKIDNTYHRIDLLLFNYIYNCFVVVELKIGEFKDRYISQVLKYTNYIDKNIKKGFHANTIGIIICNRDNKLIMEYCSNPNIIIREYILN